MRFIKKVLQRQLKPFLDLSAIASGKGEEEEKEEKERESEKRRGESTPIHTI